MVATKLIVSIGVEIVLVTLLGRYGLGLSVAGSVLFAACVMVGLRIMVTLLSFLLAEVFRSSRAASMRIGTYGWIRLLMAEIWAVLRVFFVLHPLEPWMNKADPDTVEEGTPVLLVHGFFSNGGYWWGIKRYLRRKGIANIYTINLEPQFGDIEDFARQLAQRAAHIKKVTGRERLILVAHSMGGLVSRVYIRRLGGHMHTAKLITLGTPHFGTYHAFVLPGANMRQMRPGNGWLTELNTFDSSAVRVPTTCIYSCHDDIIAPQDSGALPGAENVAVAGIGHLEMTFSSVIQQLVHEAVKAA